MCFPLRIICIEWVHLLYNIQPAYVVDYCFYFKTHLKTEKAYVPFPELTVSVTEFYHINREIYVSIPDVLDQQIVPFCTFCNFVQLKQRSE